MGVFDNYKIDETSIAAWLQGVHLALLMQTFGSKKQQIKLLLFCSPPISNHSGAHSTW